MDRYVVGTGHTQTAAVASNLRMNPSKRCAHSDAIISNHASRTAWQCPSTTNSPEPREPRPASRDVTHCWAYRSFGEPGKQAAGSVWHIGTEREAPTIAVFEELEMQIDLAIASDQVAAN